MIKITSFYPFSNFMKITQGFREDNVIVKIKSLVGDREFEFKYTEVVEISCENNARGNQRFFGFILLVIYVVIFALFYKTIYTSPIPYRIIQIFYILATVLFLTAFIKNKSYHFSDKNGNAITSFKWSHKNNEIINKAIDLTKTKSGITQILTTDNPFNNKQPIFEFVDYDIPDYLNKSTARFYEDEILVLNKSILEESVSRIRFTTLSKKIFRGRIGNNNWGTLFGEILSLACIIEGFYTAFNIIPSMWLLIILAVLTILTVITIILRYVKQEVIGFYNKNGSIDYLIWINRSNREKVEEIIKYVQSKTPTENKV